MLLQLRVPVLCGRCRFLATTHALTLALLTVCTMFRPCSAALVGGVFNLGDVLKRLTLVGYDPSKPTLWLVSGGWGAGGGG